MAVMKMVTKIFRDSAINQTNEKVSSIQQSEVKIMFHNNHRILIVLLSFLFFSNVAFSQNTSEIAQLKTKIFELEKRLDKLERIIGKSPSTQLQHSKKWKNRALWRKLRTGMSMNEVESLLGNTEENRWRVSSYLLVLYQTLWKRSRDFYGFLSIWMERARISPCQISMQLIPHLPAISERKTIVSKLYVQR